MKVQHTHRTFPYVFLVNIGPDLMANIVNNLRVFTFNGYNAAAGVFNIHLHHFPIEKRVTFRNGFSKTFAGKSTTEN